MSNKKTKDGTDMFALELKDDAAEVKKQVRQLGKKIEEEFRQHSNNYQLLDDYSSICNTTANYLSKLSFWLSFIRAAETNYTNLELRSARPKNSFDVSLRERAGNDTYLILHVDEKQNLLLCKVWMRSQDACSVYEQFLNRKGKIEKELGLENELKDDSNVGPNNCSVIWAESTVEEFSFHDDDTWDGAITWLTCMASKFTDVFQQDW